MKMADNIVYTDVPPPRRCSQGHVMDPFYFSLKVGTHEFCLTCVEERLPALLDWFGIGRILPEEAQDDHPM